MKIADMTLETALEGLQRGEFSSRELTQAVLEAIRAGDADLGAYLSIDEEDALTQAAAADQARAAVAAGALCGVPLALKDSISVKGQPCTCASRSLREYVAPFDATASARLRAAGVVFAGRTNLDEFALGATTESSAFKVTRNPHDLTRVPGGSSGGSAAAVAAGMALAALGSDTGGSVRQPAAFCGCVGLKPAYGRISRYGLTPCASSMDQIGPITRNVTDAAILLQVMAGADPLDTTTRAAPPPDYAAALRGGFKGLRIGLPREYFAGGIEAEVLACVNRAVDLAASAGAEIIEVSMPHTEYAVAAYCLIAAAEAAANLARIDGVRYGHRAANAGDVFALYANSRGEGFGMEVKRRILLGTHVLCRGNYELYFDRAQRARTLVRQDFAEVSARCDVLFAPVTPMPAYPLGTRNQQPLEMYRGESLLVPVSLAGLGALSVPCGRTPAGLPVGLQVIGVTPDERAILRAARAVEMELQP